MQSIEMHGTNNWVEFQVLDLLLKLAVDGYLDRLQVLGDSKLITDWMCATVNFINLGFQDLLDQVHSQNRGRFSGLCHFQAHKL